MMSKREREREGKKWNNMHSCSQTKQKKAEKNAQIIEQNTNIRMRKYPNA